MFKTTGYPGKINKTIKVYTSDPEISVINLLLTGEIKKQAIITPPMVLLKGKVDEKITQTITIFPNTDASIEVKKITALKGIDFKFSIEDYEEFGRKGYKLTVENIKTTEGRYSDKIIIVTNKSDLPTLSIVVSGDIKKNDNSKEEVSKIQPELKDKVEK
jgi:hypothetical protein